MEENVSKSSLWEKQIKRYAEDLSQVYKNEKLAKKELQNVSRQLLRYAEDMNKTISELNALHQELEEAYLDTIQRLALAAEYKDEDTGEHIIRIGYCSAFIAEKMDLPAKEVKNILYAAPMHDVGKIGIPETILLKPGKLTDEEFAVMKTHSTIGAKLLANSKSEILQAAEKIAFSHHEKWNGKGYPQGLAGKNIPLIARIVGLVDVFDALRSKRPYKEAYPVAVAVDIIKKESGQHFDPEVVAAFLENVEEVLKVSAKASKEGGAGIQAGFDCSKKINLGTGGLSH
jgi:putative two-component system response regulator